MFGKIYYEFKKREKMKGKIITESHFQILPKNELRLITGGHDHDGEDEYIYVIIDGVLKRIKVNRKGEPISEPETV